MAPGGPVAARKKFSMSENEEIRYNLRLPSSIYDELEQIAKKYGTNRLELIRKFIRLGLLAVELEKQPESGLYIKRSGELEKLLIL